MMDPYFIYMLLDILYLLHCLLFYFNLVRKIFTITVITLQGRNDTHKSPMPFTLRNALRFICALDLAGCINFTITSSHFCSLLSLSSFLLGRAPMEYLTYSPCSNQDLIQNHKDSVS